jgi:hypothetical protein
MTKTKNRGFAIPLVLFTLSIICVIGLASSAVGVQSFRTARSTEMNVRAHYAAEAGLARALSELEANYKWNGYSGNKRLVFQDVKMPTSNDTYTIWVCNRFFSADNQIPTEIINKNIDVKLGNCYILSKGQSGLQTKYSSVMLSIISSSSKSFFPFKNGIVSRNNFSASGNGKIVSYDSLNPASNTKGEALVACLGDDITFSGNASIDGVIYVNSDTVLNLPSSYLDNQQGNGKTFEQIFGKGNQDNQGNQGNPGGNQPGNNEPDSGNNNENNIEYQEPGSDKVKLVTEEIKFADVLIPHPDTHPYLFYKALPPGNTNGNIDPGYYSEALSVSGQNSVTLTAASGSTEENPTIYVFKSLSITGQGELKINTSNGPVRLYLYDESSGGGTTLNVAGNGVTTGVINPADFVILTPSQNTVQIAGNGKGHFCVYAPNALVKTVGNGDFFGGIISNNFQLAGNGDVNFDVNLKKTVLPELVSNDPIPVITSWLRF